MLLILVASLRECGEKFSLKEIVHTLPATTREQLSSVRPPQRQFGAAVGRLMLRRVLTDWGYPSEVLAGLQINQYGKPHFENGPFFSLSYSADLVVCAASLAGPVGVDVEHITAFDHTGMHLFFTPEEWAQIQAGPPEVFFRFWTRKESVIKADGRGVSLPLEKVSVVGKKALLPGENPDWHIFDFTPRPGYCAALCTSGAPDEMPVIRRCLPEVL